MKYVGFIFLGIATFIIGVASYLILTEKAKEKDKMLSSLEKARKAKSEKAELRKLNGEIEGLKNVNNDALEEISDLIIKNNASEEKTIED